MPLPPQVPIVGYPTPHIADNVLTEVWDTLSASYEPAQPGQQHPNLREYPNFAFVAQVAIAGTEKWVTRIWVNDRAAQNTYNAAVAFSGDANAYPVFQRTYLVRRRLYNTAADPIPAKLSLLTGVVSVKVTAGGSGYGDAPPTVSFSGGAGSGATAVAVVYRGAVVAVIMTAEGTGWDSASPPSVVFTPTDGGTGATATATIQPKTAYLVSEQADRMEGDPLDSLYLRVTRVYETLPGPWVPFTRYDENLGPIQGRRRAVANTGQAATLTATAQTTYEGREGSSIVSWQLEESWTDGTGSGGNPAFPILTGPQYYDDERGAVSSSTQIVALASQAGTLVVTDTLATWTRYEQFNEFLLKKVVESWVLPGPAVVQVQVERESSVLITTTRTMKRTSTITEGVSLSGSPDVWNSIESERSAIGADLSFEVLTSIPRGDHYDEATAIVEEESRPFSFPGRIVLTGATTAEILATYRKAFGAVVPHTIKTWWVNSATKPTISLDLMFPQTLVVAEGTILDAVLHDSFSYAGVTIPATTPTGSAFIADWIDSTRDIDGSVKSTAFDKRWKVQLVQITMK